MIKELEIENYGSINKSQKLNFVSGRGTKFKDYIPVIEKVKTKISPISCFMGPNGAGKTTFLNALSAIKKLVLGTDITLSSVVVPYKLDKECENQPTKMRIQFVCSDDSEFELFFILSNQKIYEEKLSLKNYSGTKVLYSRKDNQVKSSQQFGEERKNIWTVLSANVSSEVLFINNIKLPVMQKAFPWAMQIFKWFSHLVLVTPLTKYFPVPVNFVGTKNREQPIEIQSVLRDLGTGLDKIIFKSYPFANLKASIQDDLKKQLKPGTGVAFSSSSDYFLANMNKEDGSIQISRFITSHKDKDNRDVHFNLSEESDGIRRLIELGPILLSLFSKDAEPYVFVIDELDRRFHTLLTRSILALFLRNSSPSSRKQLIFTCHDLLLMTGDILRRDQMYLVKNEDNGSEFFRINEMKQLRADKDIMKLYLSGVLGGIPRVSKVSL